MSTDLTIAVCDFWPRHQPDSNPVLASLRRHADLAPARIPRADLVVYSVFGRRHEAIRGTGLAVSGEPMLPPRRYAQWTIDWRHLPHDHHLRLPFWAMVLARPERERVLADERSALGDLSSVPERFCNFIYSNAGCEMRNAFFVALHSRRPVDALGSVFHNADDARLSSRVDPAWSATKRTVLADYRFTIAFENEEHPGYTTEKMVDAWRAGSVPIYWGDPAVVADFPSGSYLSLYEAGSMSRLVEQVLEAEHEPERYRQLREANPLLTGVLGQRAAHYAARLDEFSGRVIADVEQHRGRRRPLTDIALRRPLQVAAAGARGVRRSLALSVGR